MSAPLLVSIPHRLGKEEALRRIKSGLANARTNYSAIIAVDEEVWTGDRLLLRVRALGQSVSGLIDVCDDCVRLEVTLPWLLAKFAERVVPTLRREATLTLEKK
ncbi:MAG: polyhydroxyalkanoic acid system family protein [Xanthobacteraceae bacterium]|nr:polyhydroxyalkanoic acid system family protein [Xanthobacteraceae bacterium]